MEDRPKRIKAQILPYDVCNVDTLLNSLAHGFIIRYMCNGEKYVQIVNFLKHQNPHIKESPSTIPAPEPDVHSTRTVQKPDKNSTNPASSLIPSSLIPDSFNPLTLEPDVHFETFWENYPRKISRTRTLSVWKTRVKEGIKPTDLIKAAENYATYNQDKEPQYIKHPATFLGPSKAYEDFIDGYPLEEDGGEDVKRKIRDARERARKRSGQGGDAANPPY